MADVTLSEREATHPGELPNCCMRCGRHTTNVVEREFSNRSNSGSHRGTAAAALGAFIGRMIVEAVSDPPRQMTVRMPLCEGCQGHWFLTNALMMAVMIFFMCGGIFYYLYVMVNLPPSAWWPTDLLSQLGLLFFIVGLVPAAALCLWVSPIRASRIWEGRITLSGVSPLFVQAVERGTKSTRHDPKRG